MQPQTDLLANRYRLTSLIAGGGMGQVWRGHDALLDRPVAVKVLRDQFAGNATFLTRFRAEAQHAAVLTHPHIAAVFDYGEVTGPGGVPLAYLVMELVEGESLADLLARERQLDAARTVDIVQQAADGLAAAHAAGVVHRDVKPANVLVTPRGVVKITDFGIARSASSVAITGTGQVIGTAHYFAPEQASGGQATPASDVYALGAVAYECLAGRRPFEADNPVQIAVMHIREEPAPLPAGVPDSVRALVERAMAKDPRERFPDGGAFRDAAARLNAGLPTSPGPTARPPATAVLPVSAPGTVPLAAQPAARSAGTPRRWLIPALAALAAVLVAVAVLTTVLPDRTGTPATGEDPAPTTPARIEVLAGDLVGRPVQEVQAELVGRGLAVELVPVEVAGVPAGQVTAVDPAGTLAPGDLVRLSYAVTPVPAPVPPAPSDPGGGAGTGTTDEEEQREEERQEREEERQEREEERRQDEEERRQEREEERQEREEQRQEEEAGGEG